MSIIARAKSVKGSLKSAEYKENKEKKSVLIFQNHLNGENYRERWDEMRTIAKLNQRTAKKFLEVVLSPATSIGKTYQFEDWEKLAKDFTRKIGAEENQWYAVLHQNTDQPHLHISINRINFEGKNTIDSGFIGKKAGIIADELARARKLKTAKELTQDKKRAILSVLNDSLRKSISLQGLEREMALNGLKLILNSNSSGYYGGRIIPIDEINENPSRREELSKKGFKFSELDRKLKVNNLLEIIEQNRRNQERQQEQDRYRGLRR
ncbi:relaxase/mobilization nuclease domain-containing protein [Ornithobacterium rhinotracheale]